VTELERRFVEQWEAAIARRDPEAVTALLADDVAFYSPAVHRPYEGRELVAALLGHVIEVFDELTYTGVYTSGDGGVVMQFQATVQGPDRVLRLEGVDVFRLDGEGLIRDMRVMIRPLNGLQALAQAMAARLGLA
jgi:hypothetical protein